MYSRDYSSTNKMLAFPLSIIFLAVTADAAVVLRKAVTTTHPNGLMFDGIIIKINEAPYHVSIGENKDERCAGVILSKDYVLTAAHCDVCSYDAIVRAGSSLRNSAEGSSHTLIRCEVHENSYVDHGYLSWDKSRDIVMANDIALLKISPPIKLDEKRQAISMFDEGEDVGSATDALITGWTNVNGSEHLTTQTVDIFPTSSGDEFYQNVGGVPAGQICATYPRAEGKTGCVGVSGGPLVVDGRLAGILSWGNGCVKRNGPGVYTEIAYYRRWIDETMQKYNKVSD